MANKKRLIDANKTMNSIVDLLELAWGYDGIREDVQQIFENAETVDAVPVVRCEKCKHAVWDEEYEMWKCDESVDYDEESGGYFGVCEYHYGDFFCSYGERKDGDGNG